MNQLEQSVTRSLPSVIGTAGAVLMIGILNLHVDVAHAGPVTQPISQVPLTTVVANHPQILFAVGNSESMDGTLSGAIMTGSGSLGSSLSSLSTSSSPTSYTIPTGFTPPVTPLAAGTAAYTVKTSGTLYDNGPSRMNVAKGGIAAILSQYMKSADFALMDYKATSGTTLYTTWAYYMSPSGGFTFTNTAPTDGTPYVSNPCSAYGAASSTVKSNCGSLDGTLYSNSISPNAYMVVGASSDDPNINDVLYTGGGQPGIFISYNGPSPANPYTAYTLAQYNSNLGNILSSYSKTTPGGGGWGTYPTNAGYIPFSPQVMYAERGFGYGANTSSTTGATVVGMTSAIVPPATTPNSATIAAAIAKFTPFLAPETNDTGTTEIKSLGGQSALPALLAGAATELAKDKPASNPNGCPTFQYVVLITDGLPTQDSSGNNWPPLGSAAAAGYGVTASFNADGTVNTTNDQALTDTITKITALKTAGVETYVIGLGAGVDATKNPVAAQTLHAMAVAGATGSDYLPATSPQALVDALGNVLQQVLAKNISTSSAAANSTTLNTGSQVYQATFSSADWSGDLAAYAIDPSTAVITTSATWNAQLQLDKAGWSGRHIATWDPYATSGPVGVGFNLTSAGLSATLQTQLAATPPNGGAKDTVANRVDYLRGNSTLEQGHASGIYRSRTHLLGDVVDSSPTYVNVPSGSYADASYDSFVSTYSGRAPMIYFGANDGMLHGVDAATGNETMAFIPNGVFANLPKLTDPLYNQHHLFFVDGSPQTRDVLLADGNWHTLLVGGENAGGKSIYALDITDPSTFTSDASVASAAKWEFTDADMGLSFSTPTIVRSNAVSVTDAVSKKSVQGFAVLFGNGYNSSTGDAIFYAVNASTGVVIRKIDLCTVVTTACSATTPNGLSSITAINSSGVIGIPEDMAYAGDLQGNLWAINMSNTDPSKWTAALLFQARDSSGNAQPITTAPALTPNPHFPDDLGLMAFFGTGQLLTQSDLTNLQTQTFYGVWDNTLDLANYSAPVPAPPYHRGDLQQQTVSLDTSTSVKVVQSSDNPVNLTYAALTAPALATQEGWYFDLDPLNSTQESARSVTNPQVESGGVVFTTNALSSSACAVGGASYLMNVKYDTGGPFAKPAIGLGGGINIGNGTVSGKNPTGVFIGNGYSSEATTVKSSAGTNVQIISTSNGLQVVPTLGNKSARVGWWQIQ
jgi:type IV pilus assembly protein PilY1